ncbi:bifunctional glycosyltransferase/CDP-glycerol:glycerophosphate glycerophosphotransferase [Actinoplanes subtropicus]|uniref:bifunctional glycosyltransferase/CDP-glycerol:glycerophosphate glycerophosphotransferase n=1 Tax=Actinoplanes subtropicus TaxID=543632 RepID=UPI0004C467DC|nr:bifunctional glycosyltransferase family 2 protein/CDP-glycerol:glycerophosphate glycerophosphotransferase [Actinoplanes subtropicus]
MTFLSIVLPVYRVQGYLRQCLDSVLGQSFDDFEIVAVDDCSPDYSGRILAEYAARDPRVRVLTSPANVGLGRARNLGLEHARGTYVWFLDSDDWLAAGALAAVAGRLRATEADVLVVGWDRVHWDGPVQSGSAGAVLGDAPRVFSVEQWPQVLNVLHVAWNRVIRRELLDRLGLAFEAGWYEDVSFTFPLMVAAPRISGLPRTCVHYRQRRTGAITRTVGERHFEVFEHWEHALGLCAKYAEARPAAYGDEVRDLLFQRMLWHLTRVLRHDARVPVGSRRRFFARMTEMYQRHRPPRGAFSSPGSGEGLRYRFVGRGAYRSYLVAEVAMRVTRDLQRRAGRPRRKLVRLGRQVFGRLYYRLQLLRPVDPSLALYAAYWYRGVACNPAAIAAKAAELVPEVRAVWVVGRSRVAAVPPGVDYVVEDSRAYYRALARARYLINNVNWPNMTVKRRGTTHVMTHHGTPLKMMGMDQLDHPAAVRDTDFTGQMRRADRWDFSVTANAHSTIAWERAYPCAYETLEVGYPRNDRLATATAAEVAAVRERLGIAPGRRVVLYMPTHREWLPKGARVLDVERLAGALGPDTDLLVREHYFAEVAGHPVVEDLYLAADVLLTDYSSAMFDFAVLDRPLVIFAPDWPVYRDLRGVYFDLLAQPPGPVATEFDELVKIFQERRWDDAARRAFRERFCGLDDGGAAERVVRRVFRDPR